MLLRTRTYISAQQDARDHRDLEERTGKQRGGMKGITHDTSPSIRFELFDALLVR
jgi:hypothetical protein